MMGKMESIISDIIMGHDFSRLSNESKEKLWQSLRAQGASSRRAVLHLPDSDLDMVAAAGTEPGTEQVPDDPWEVK